MASPTIWQKIWEVVKELLRYVVCSLPAIIITWVSGQAWDPSVIAISTMALKALDKVLHDWGKANGSTLLEGGLTRF